CTRHRKSEVRPSEGPSTRFAMGIPPGSKVISGSDTTAPPAVVTWPVRVIPRSHIGMPSPSVAPASRYSCRSSHDSTSSNEEPRHTWLRMVSSRFWVQNVGANWSVHGADRQYWSHGVSGHADGLLLVQVSFGRHRFATSNISRAATGCECSVPVRVPYSIRFR